MEVDSGDQDVSLEDRFLQSQEDLAIARNQTLLERNRAKKLARKLEDLRARIIELKEDKNKLEAYVQNERNLYGDLQECLEQYRRLKTIHDSVIMFIKIMLEKTTGELDIEEIDNDTNEMRLDLKR